nr:uncharacterized protein LOC104120557 [Nicotiana tomentosiformis]
MDEPIDDGLLIENQEFEEESSEDEYETEDENEEDDEEELEPSRECSECITNSFKYESDPNGVNWKSISDEIKKFYFGEFNKAFYWDSSIDSAVRNQWECRATKRYSDFISKLKSNGVQRDSIQNNVWQSWMRLWKDPKCVEKSKINAKTRCAGNGVATGTHTGGSISVGEHRKRLVSVYKISENLI